MSADPALGRLARFMRLARTIFTTILALVLSQVPALTLDAWADARAGHAVATSCCGAKCKRCLEAARRGEPCTRCHKTPAAVPWKTGGPATEVAKKGCPRHRREAAETSATKSAPGDDERTASAPDSRAPRVAGGPCSWPEGPAAAPAGASGARMVAARVPCPLPEPGRFEPEPTHFRFDFLPEDVPFVPI